MNKGPMPKVIIESPLHAATEQQIAIHVEYARQCVTDCLRRGEAPFASHLFYPQVLDDHDPIQRELGMAAGFAWMYAADYVVVYTDFGMSTGMKAGIKQAQAYGLEVKYRSLDHATDPNPHPDPESNTGAIRER